MFETGTVLRTLFELRYNIPQRFVTLFKILQKHESYFQILQVTATDVDTGNNARLTYRIASSNESNVGDTDQDVFGIFPDNGFLYLREMLDRELRDTYDLIVVATDNGTPPQMATSRVSVRVLDANDNDPVFTREFYEFSVEENLRRGSAVGAVSAKDLDLGANSTIRYSIKSTNSSFQMNPITGEF